jgi:hypothetical protein
MFIGAVAEGRLFVSDDVTPDGECVRTVVSIIRYDGPSVGLGCAYAP